VSWALLHSTKRPLNWSCQGFSNHSTYWRTLQSHQDGIKPPGWERPRSFSMSAFSWHHVPLKLCGGAADSRAPPHSGRVISDDGLIRMRASSGKASTHRQSGLASCSSGSVKHPAHKTPFLHPGVPFLGTVNSSVSVAPQCRVLRATGVLMMSHLAALTC
jgi:hypothetical protein